MTFLVVMLCFGVATALIARAKGSSLFIWFFIGAITGPIGLVAVILHRREKSEPERQCPRCRKTLKLYVQVCPGCGEDLYLPEVTEVRPGPDFRQA